MRLQTVSEVSTAARGRWPHILSALGITVPAGHRHGACPKCGGTDRFRLDDKEGRGTWFCNQCGNGDGLDLIRLVTGKSVLEVSGLVAGTLSMPETDIKPAVPASNEAVRKANGKARFHQLEKTSVQGETPYLTGRGLFGHVSALLGHPVTVAGTGFPDGSLLLALADTDGVITGGQLISPEGEKNLLPGSQLTGAFIALTEIPSAPPEQVIITEGFATALTASLLSSGWVVAAVAATNLVRVAEKIRQKWPDKYGVFEDLHGFTGGKALSEHLEQGVADVYCSCTNVECGHTFVMSVSFSHTISPSALKGQGRVKELIDALPEQDREKALEFLLQAKKKA